MYFKQGMKLYAGTYYLNVEMQYMNNGLFIQF